MSKIEAIKEEIKELRYVVNSGGIFSISGEGNLKKLEYLIRIAEAATEYLNYSNKNHGHVEFEIYEKLAKALEGE